jgi:hypothetical protein
MWLGGAGVAARTRDSAARVDILNGSVHELESEDGMADKVDDLASDVDDALVSADELENDPGIVKAEKIQKVKDSLEQAQDMVDDMQDAED